MSTTNHHVRPISDSGIYKAFFETHPDAVYVVDLEGKYVDANAACTNVFGYAREEFLSTSFQQIVVPDKLHFWLSSVVEQWFRGEPATFETTIYHKKGHCVELHITDTPIVIDGNVVGVFGIAKDITNQKTTEKLLKERSERYESLKKYNPNGICSFNLDGTVLGANPAYERITGYSLDELRQMDAFEALLAPDGQEEARMALKDLFVSSETRIKHKDGHLVDVSATNVPIIVDNKQIGVYIILQDITKQKQVQQELLNTQRLYQLISENSQDVISYSNSDGTFGYISPSVKPLLGYDPNELIGKPNFNLYHPDDIPYLTGIAKRIVAGEDVPRFTCRVHCKNGTYRWYETTLKIVRDEQGKVLQTVGVGRDISEQMNLQESLEEAVRIAGLAHWEWDMSNGTIIYSNQAYSNLGLEHTNDVFTYERFKSFVHPEDVELLEQGIKHALETGGSFEREFRLVRSDGSIRYLHSVAEVLLDEADHPVRMIGISHDITHSKLLELQLKQSEERYRRLVENPLIAIGVIMNGKWAYLNPTGLKMFGASNLDEVLGRNHSDFLHPDHHEECKLRVRSVFAGRSISFVEQKFYKLSGEIFHAEVVGLPFGENAIQVIMHDVTERKTADEMLLKSEKLSAAGQLAAGIAHEIRNPLTALKGFTQMLREKATGTNRRYFDIMNAELDRIEMILNEMLVLAKPQVPNFKLQPVDLILHEVVTLLSTQAMMKNVIIRTDSEGDLPLVLCEEGQLKQVFVNVIKNGIEAMPSGGNLLVRIKTDSKKLSIEFVDEGEGIPEERIPRLGEPFFTTKEKGTGLGLMVCQKIISAHHGAISISSKLGQGTTVTVSLPIQVPGLMNGDDVTP